MARLGNLRRAGVVWMAWMTGVLSLVREVVFAYQSATGQPVTGGQTLAVLGHLGIVAFIVCVALAWRWEHARVVELESERGQPATLTTEHIERLSDARREIAALKSQIEILQPRSVSDSQRQAIAAVLSRHPVDRPTIWIEHNSTVADSETYASELAMLFEAAGWHAPTGSVRNDERYKVGMWVFGANAEERQIVAEALHAAGLKFQIDESPERDGDASTSVVIGRRE